MANQIVEDIKFKIKSGNSVTKLIVINIAVFLIVSIIHILLSFSGRGDYFSIVQDNISLPLSISGFLYKPWTIISYMFLHYELGHIFWNLITLFWFGNILSEFTNSKKIIPLYLLGGLAGGLFTIACIKFIPSLQIYSFSHLVGASAGVTAIIIAAAALVPSYSLNLMFIGPVKLIYVALFVIFIDILSLASYSNVGGNIAHIGGAAMGYFFIDQYKRGRDLSKGINSFLDFFRNIFSSKPKSKMKVAYKKPMSDADYNYQKKVTQDQIDAILDKISKSGYSSLSNKEKEILFKASNKN